MSGSGDKSLLLSTIDDHVCFFARLGGLYSDREGCKIMAGDRWELAMKVSLSFFLFRTVFVRSGSVLVPTGIFLVFLLSHRYISSFLVLVCFFLSFCFVPFLFCACSYRSMSCFLAFSPVYFFFFFLSVSYRYTFLLFRVCFVPVYKSGVEYAACGARCASSGFLASQVSQTAFPTLLAGNGDKEALLIGAVPEPELETQTSNPKTLNPTP